MVYVKNQASVDPPTAETSAGLDFLHVIEKHTDLFMILCLDGFSHEANENTISRLRNLDTIYLICSEVHQRRRVYLTKTAFAR